MDWEELGDWWVGELAADPAYAAEVEPAILDLLGSVQGGVVLDAGCGDGRMMRRAQEVGWSPLGVDISKPLLGRAVDVGPVVRAALPDLRWLGTGSVDAVMVVLVLEHLADHGRFFTEAARVCRAGGRMVLIMNHPFFTAPGSAPVVDVDETLWRPGFYFSNGTTEEPAGNGTVTFHHRNFGEMLTRAASGGWNLQECREYGPSARQMKEDRLLAGQAHFPRLLACSWFRSD